MKPPRWTVTWAMAVVAAAVLTCGQSRPSPEVVYRIVLPSGISFFSEDPAHPELRRLREEENLDDVVTGAASDLERLETLALWASQRFPASTPFPNYPPWNARIILREVRGGRTGGFCAQYALVFGQAAQSFGYPVRYVELTSENHDDDHVVTEVYITNEGRWVVFDAQNAVTYASGNRVLSVYELRNILFGPQGGAVMERPSGRKLTRQDLPVYAHFQYHLRNNFLSAPVYYEIRPLYFDPLKEHQGQMGRVVCQWNFEPRKIRFSDDNMPYRRGYLAEEIIRSSSAADFDFSVDVDGAREVRIDTLAQLQAELSRNSLGARRLILRPGVFADHQRSQMARLASFEPLSEAGASLDRYAGFRRLVN